MNTEQILTCIEELKSKENDLIKMLNREHQIVDCIILLETLTERKVMNKMLHNSLIKPSAKRFYAGIVGEGSVTNPARD